MLLGGILKVTRPLVALVAASVHGRAMPVLMMCFGGAKKLSRISVFACAPAVQLNAASIPKATADARIAPAQATGIRIGEFLAFLPIVARAF